MISLTNALQSLKNITKNIAQNSQVKLNTIQLQTSKQNSGVHTLKNNKYSVIINISRLYDHIAIKIS